MNIEQRILCLAARTQIDSNDKDELLRLLQGPVDWERLWAQAYLHEVLPLLTKTLHRFEGQNPTPTSWMLRAQRYYYATLVHNITLADELLSILTALENAGVKALPVKGIVLAETLYGDLALRPAKDLDVLVRPPDLPAARTVLYSLGFAHRARLPFSELHHPYQDPKYFRRTAAGEVCLELHRMLWPARAFHLAPDIFWDRTIVTQIHGAQVRILSPEDTLLLLAIHRTRSPLRLRWICDIAELLRRHNTTLDWDYVLCQAQVAGARTTLFFSLMLSQELLGAPLLPKILPSLGLSPIKLRLLDNACGVPALFHPTSADPAIRRRHSILRILEHDSGRQILWTLSSILTGRVKTRLHNYAWLLK